MFLKNFFDEKIFIKNTNDVENELDKQYGLPREHQDIHRVGENTFISMHNTSTSCNHGDATPELAINSKKLADKLGNMEELGVPATILEKISNMDADQRNVFVKLNLFPYVFDDSSYNATSKKIDKTGIDDVDTYVKNMSPDDRDIILKNVDSYIDSFLN